MIDSGRRDSPNKPVNAEVLSRVSPAGGANRITGVIEVDDGFCDRRLCSTGESVSDDVEMKSNWFGGAVKDESTSEL